MTSVLARTAIALVFAGGSAGAETIEIGDVKRSYLTQFPETKPAPLPVISEQFREASMGRTQ
jgi:hypothetical protein